MEEPVHVHNETAPESRSAVCRKETHVVGIKKNTWYPSDECRIRKVFICQTMVRRMPIRLPVRKGAFSFVSRLSFVRETFGLGDPLTKPSEQDAGSEGRTSNIGSKNVFNYPVRSH